MDGEQIGVVNASLGSLSQFLLEVQEDQYSRGALVVGNVDPIKTIQVLIGEMQKNLNLGIGYAIKTSEIKPLHPILKSCVL